MSTKYQPPFSEEERESVKKYNEKRAAKHGLSLQDYLWNLEKLQGKTYYPPTEGYWG